MHPPKVTTLLALQVPEGRTQTVTYDDGSRGDKARELALAAEFNQQIESSTLDDFTVKVYGDTAVVWFTQHLVGISKGQRLEIALRYVDVFVLRDAKWQCVASHTSLLPK